jgi:hypothetical protein
LKEVKDRLKYTFTVKTENCAGTYKSVIFWPLGPMIKEIHYKMGGGYLTIAKLFEVLCRHSLFDFSTNFLRIKGVLPVFR